MKIIRDEMAAMAKVRDEGKEEGRKEGIQKIAKKMIEKGENVEYIAEITGLNKEEIENL